MRSGKFAPAPPWAKFPDAVNARVVTLDELKKKWHMSKDAYAALIKLQKEECKKRSDE